MSDSSLEKLISILEKPTPSDIALISKAYHFAKEAHQSHLRFSGEPYFNHLFATAVNLAELRMGPITISAGLLHDSLEDANISRETLEKEFGKEILFLVEGVTKLGHVRYHGAERHVESLRKFFVAVSKDLRVLIIKLCDRLHNMETLAHVREEKRERIAKETLEIYSALAYRLGIRKLSRRLADLSFPYVYPEEHKRTEELLSKRLKKETSSHLEKMLKSVKKELGKAGITEFFTSYRVKGLYNLYLKLKRKDWDIEKIYDISALRIIVPTVADCYAVLGVIHGNWMPLPGRIKDYIAFPKRNGYQGIHTTIFTGDGTILEVQIRTKAMNREAEYGIASHFEYKEEMASKEEVMENSVSWVKEILPSFTIRDEKDKDIPLWVENLRAVESFPKDPAAFMETLAVEFFGNRVFVFTPKGDVMDLPQGASIVDFAYAIHSDIGNHMAGAKVNGKIVPLNRELKNGEIVEVVTKESAHPSLKWIEFCKTSLAQKHIRTAVKLQIWVPRKENPPKKKEESQSKKQKSARKHEMRKRKKKGKGEKIRR
ncbi:MAG: HD domain-containing protein [bacterium]|nr:HD domain-containing protein [bacterium]